MDSTQQLLKFEQVSALVGLGRTAIYRKVREGTFPPPLHISRRASRWRAADVQRWIDGLPTEKPTMQQPTEFEKLTYDYLMRRYRSEGRTPPSLEAVQRYAREVEDLITSRLSWPTAPISQLVMAQLRLKTMAEEFRHAESELQSMGLDATEAKDALEDLPKQSDLEQALMHRIKAELPDLDILEPAMRDSELQQAEQQAQREAASDEAVTKLIDRLEAEGDLQLRRIKLVQTCGYGSATVFDEQQRMNRISASLIAARDSQRAYRKENPVTGGPEEMTQADFAAWSRRAPLEARAALQGGKVRIV